MNEAHPSWWDPDSDQPHKLSAHQKPRITTGNLTEFATTTLSTVGLLPLIAWRYATLKPTATSLDSLKEFAGLGVSPDRECNGATREMVEELGVRHLLIRVPCWHIDRLDDYLRFAELFRDRVLLINILQDRQRVTDLEQWQRTVTRIIDAFKPLTNQFQLGNAINRSKWGCHNTGEYLALLDSVNDLKHRHPDLQLAGSSVIDFEPIATLRTLINFHHYKLDICSALLYVNRRGSPYSRQFGLFDLQRKIRLIAALVSLSNRCGRKLWITETNWPLLNTKPYTPNSGHPRSTVDEATQARYLTEYFRIAHDSGLVDRVYWWQLINPGYGLVDHRTGQLRKMPSYDAFKALLGSTPH